MHLGESPENFIRNFRSECVSEWQEQIHNGCDFGSAAGEHRGLFRVLSIYGDLWFAFF